MSPMSFHLPHTRQRGCHICRRARLAYWAAVGPIYIEVWASPKKPASCQAQLSGMASFPHPRPPSPLSSTLTFREVCYYTIMHDKLPCGVSLPPPPPPPTLRPTRISPLLPAGPSKARNGDFPVRKMDSRNDQEREKNRERELERENKEEKEKREKR